MKFLKAAIPLLLGVSAIAHAVPATDPLASDQSAILEILKREGCDREFEELARAYLREHANLVSIYVEKLTQRDSWESVPGQRDLDVESLKLCGARDLDPGSYDLRREVSLCSPKGDVVELFTHGSLYCTDEVVLGIKNISMP